MELRQLEYFVAVVDTGTFTAGAAAAHATQPALSQSIASLEADLGAALFHRLRRGVTLTPAGRALVEPARQALRDAATARAAVRDVAGLAAGRLELISLPTLAAEPLARWVGAFRRAHPGVALAIGEAERADGVVDAVVAGRSELGLAELPAGRDLRVALTIDQEVLLVCPPEERSGRAERATTTVRALRDVPIVATPQGTSTRRLIDAAFAAAGLEPRIAVEMAQREAILPLVLAGAGYSFLPEPMARAAAARGAVVRSLRPALRRSVGLVHRPGPMSPAAGAFVAVAQSAET